MLSKLRKIAKMEKCHRIDILSIRWHLLLVDKYVRKVELHTIRYRICGLDLIVQLLYQ